MLSALSGLTIRVVAFRLRCLHLCNWIMSSAGPNILQAKAKFRQTGPSRPKDKSKKMFGFSLDFLCRIEPFQCVAPTPKAQKCLLLSSRSDNAVALLYCAGARSSQWRFRFGLGHSS